MNNRMFLPAGALIHVYFPYIRICLLVLMSCSGQLAATEQRATDSLIDKLQDNLRLTLDLSSRISDFHERDRLAYTNVIGIDAHKVWSTQKADIGTFILQGYLTRIDNLPLRPGFFDDEDDWEFVFRIFNFNFTGLGPGRPNFRFGHFEIPFGLEHSINTNGTLRDYTHGRNLGVKADWGASVNGGTKYLEYEFGASMGGVQEFKRVDGSFVFAGRIGTPRDNNQVLGISLYKGELGGIQRERIGIDAQWYLGLWGVFAEFSSGRTEQQTVFNSLLEVNWRNPQESWLLYAQAIRYSQDFNTGWDEALALAAGCRYVPDNHWAFSAQIKNDVSAFARAIEERIISLQIRYRF